MSDAVITGVDHLTIAVAKLDDALASYRALFGHDPVWRGSHPELGTEAALFALENTWIELVAPKADAEEAEGLRQLIQTRGEGLLALALSTDDAAACSSALRAKGVRAAPPSQGDARGENGTVRRFATVELSPRVTRGLSVFAVARADALPKHADVVAHDALHALDHVVIRTSNLDAAKALYGDAFGIRLALESTVLDRRILFFRVGGVTIEVVEDLARGEQDAFYGASYRTRDLDAAHARIASVGFDLSDARVGMKPNTRVFSVRNQTAGVATLVLWDPKRG